MTTFPRKPLGIKNYGHIQSAMASLGEYGFHGALDRVEGAVWRVERNELACPGRGGERRRVVDFLAKFVWPEKIDGSYLPEITGREPHWNWRGKTASPDSSSDKS